MKTFKLLLILMLLSCLGSCSKEDDEIYLNPITESKNSYSKMELEILSLVNNYRNTLEINKLNKLDVVSSVASTHSKYMAEIGKVSHDNFPERHKKLVSSAMAKVVGENVGYGFNTAKGVFNAWIASDSHRVLIENSKYTHFGISTEQSNDNRNYFTLIFITK
ncbi:CAP domain-containing protein [uncultured Lutibacter sp.]|uniref:CAP domain-containing protein n=1 Tax=uncultured Lutibacter sp. TaxID=437739 RepID=UPI00261D3F66|nr:CAP domain-containing protein [uncultured Lutibacter sp.]